MASEDVKVDMTKIVKEAKDMKLPEPGDNGFLTLKEIGIDISDYKQELPARMKTKPDVQRQILNANAELIAELIINGWSFFKIAKRFNIATTTFFGWKRDSEFAPLIELAVEESAERDIDKAFDVLKTPAGEKEMADVQRRRALAELYKWRASKRKPKVYGKQDTNTNVTVNVETPDNKSEFFDLLKAVKKKSQIEAAKSDKGTEDAEIVPDSDNG